MAIIDYDLPKEIKSYEPKNPKGRNCQCIFGAKPTNSKIEQFVQKSFSPSSMYWTPIPQKRCPSRRKLLTCVQRKRSWIEHHKCTVEAKQKKGSYLPRSVQPDHPQVDLLGVRKKLSSYKDATPARLRAREGQQFRGSRCSASLQGWKDWSQGWQKVPSLWSRYVPPRPSCPPEKKIYSNKCLPFFCTFCCRLLFHYLHFHYMWIESPWELCRWWLWELSWQQSRLTSCTLSTWKYKLEI